MTMPADHTHLERLAPHSVEVTKNAKGEYGWTIKVYFADNEANGAIIAAKIIDTTLRREFGLPLIKPFVPEADAPTDEVAQ